MLLKGAYKTEAERELEEPLPCLQDRVYVLHNGVWCRAIVVCVPSGLSSPIIVRMWSGGDRTYSFEVENVRIAGYDLVKKKDRLLKIERE